MWVIRQWPEGKIKGTHAGTDKPVKWRLCLLMPGQMTASVIPLLLGDAKPQRPWGSEGGYPSARFSAWIQENKTKKIFFLCFLGMGPSSFSRSIRNTGLQAWGVFCTLSSGYCLFLGSAFLTIEEQGLIQHNTLITLHALEISAALNWL